MSEIDKDLKDLKNFGSVVGLGMLTGAAVLIAGAFVYVASKWAIENWKIALVTSFVIGFITALAVAEDK